MVKGPRRKGGTPSAAPAVEGTTCQKIIHRKRSVVLSVPLCLICGVGLVLVSDYDFWKVWSNSTIISNSSREINAVKNVTQQQKITVSSAEQSKPSSTPDTQPKPPIDIKQQASPQPKQEDLQEQEDQPIQHFLDLSQHNGHDKEKLLLLLRNHAGLTTLSYEHYNLLPTWAQVASMYGDQPRLQGATPETCRAFQTAAATAGWGKALAVAGMFNSGTNLLADTLLHNCAIPQHETNNNLPKAGEGIMWQMPQGKHAPPPQQEGWFVERGNDKSHMILPIVMIRDPFLWMKSLCHNFYTAHWPKFLPIDSPDNHCPALWPTQYELEQFRDKNFGPVTDQLPTGDLEFPPGTPNEGTYPLLKNNPLPAVVHAWNHKKNQTGDILPLTIDELQLHFFPVQIIYSERKRYHLSMVHFYNDWHREYYYNQQEQNAVLATNRIFLRLEDLMFHPQAMIQQVCECAGGRLVDETVRIRAQSTKESHSFPHEKEKDKKTARNGYLESMIHYGNPLLRLQGFTPLDLQYAAYYLDPKLMQEFHYNMPK
ncbi:expressed unknown protein [Seminavis robusta]|uniref:Sulfotransferase n=1 Tax=Seminavis robusta TaxID=568900 RepID=A0A9N8EPE4_9STRA|nr:expressed unknown protein [Seminavis robusta]|eukprot:Sro1487_g276740.1 n/a (540) ;mRNA; r:9336-10955